MFIPEERPETQIIINFKSEGEGFLDILGTARWWASQPAFLQASSLAG